MKRRRTGAVLKALTVAGFALASSVAAYAEGEDALVPGTDFNATGNVACSRIAGQPMSQCEAGVKRQADDFAVLQVFWPDGGSRALFFKDGKLTGADISQADGDVKASFEMQNDLYVIRVGEQRFEVPDVFILGD